MFKKILVPLDGSALAERALEPVLAIGRRNGADVILLRVLVPHALPARVPGGNRHRWGEAEHSLEPAQHEAEQYLQSVLMSTECAGITVRGEVRAGRGTADAAGIILDTAAEENADLIAMSTHGHSGITRWLLGSVAARVLRGAARPVLVIRPDRPLHKVLIPLDGSALAERALAPGLAVAAGLDAEVTLLRAVGVVSSDASLVDYLEHMERGLGRRLEEEFSKGAETYLTDLATTYQPSGLSLRTAVWSGPAAKGIVEFAATRGIDLIVMATHGRSGLQRWMYGSVTQTVLRAGGCSMLIVPPAAHDLN